ncbi:hypothetical protein C9374_004050 [Naegleria lovaniensis]|uniref:Uncharacterized protein n=1 Tax=Naegleria lovaniensis TaxID=51637 RepID=A0AA88H961_NAELO|nr:uncharacterized protein C9374_004050 [Naegleria lovaniensis]KAG2394286.1 hypothetical protein C9374_004050 [Naegleria lovaniensis]
MRTDLQASSSQKPTFEEYVNVTEEETEKFKLPLATCLQNHGFFKTFYILDQYFENYSDDPSTLYNMFYSHSKCLYSLVKDKVMDEHSSDHHLTTNTSPPQDQINLERIEQFLQFMYRADVECESTRETLERLRIEQNIDPFESDDEMIEFVFEHGPYFDRERNKFKQVLLDTIQYYTVTNRSKNYRFDFEILLGFYRLLFERHNYFAPPRSDPCKAVQDSMGETDLYTELMEECGLTVPQQQ